MSERNTIKILIVDDDADDCYLTSDYIKHIPGMVCEIEWCHRYDDAIRHMKSCNYQLYFVDYLLGAKSGVQLLKDAMDTGCEDPIILLTGKGNQKVDMEAMELGAVDYLVKSELSIEKMERAIRYALERASTLKALRANERKYRSIFEKSKDVIFITDKDLRFKQVNSIITHLLGYSVDEVLKIKLLDIINIPSQRSWLQHNLKQHKKIEDWEVMLMAADGTLKSCVLTATVEKDSEEQVYIQGIIHDITALKRAEKSNLQTEKLAAAGRLVRTLAHEVRNPLNNINLSVEQIMQEPVSGDDSVHMYLDIIQRNSNRINDLIGELLNTSKPTEMTMKAYVLQSVLDDVVSSAIDRLTLKHIKLQVNYPVDIIRVNADTEKLKIALLNIVINAIEAMDEKTGALSIMLNEFDDTAVLKITDNGCGISEENITRLFEPYFTQKRNGMGLGLASTLNILQSHKAGIDVTSRLGEGTSFIITFPIAADA